MPPRRNVPDASFRPCYPKRFAFLLIQDQALKMLVICESSFASKTAGLAQVKPGRMLEVVPLLESKADSHRSYCDSRGLPGLL